MPAGEPFAELAARGARVFASPDYEPRVHASSSKVTILFIAEMRTLSFVDSRQRGTAMLTNETTRRQFLLMASSVAMTAPLAFAAGGPRQTSRATARDIRRAILVPRFGADATADWYPAALPQLADPRIKTKVVSTLPAATEPGVAETVAAISKAVGDDLTEIAHTILIGHSVGSRALLAYLSRHGATHRPFAGVVSVAGWFTVDDLSAYPALVPWVNLELDFASIASAAGPITVYLSDNDPFTNDWQATADDWLGKLGGAGDM